MTEEDQATGPGCEGRVGIGLEEERGRRACEVLLLMAARRRW